MANFETRDEFLARLHDEGRYNEYLERRNSLKMEGYSARQIQDRLSDEFKPLRPNTYDGLEASIEDFDPDGVCDPREAVNWVAQYASISGVAAARAPSPLAWSLYQWVQESDDNRNKFFTSIWTRLLPSRSEIDKEARRADDGTVIKNIDRLLALAEEAKQEASRPELTSESQELISESQEAN